MAKKKSAKITKKEIEKEKRRLKKLMPAEKRIEEQKALRKAKELEKKHVPTEKEESEEVHEFMEDADAVRKLLKPAWYLKSKKKKKIKK